MIYKKWNWRQLSTNRNAIYALAMIWIAVFHMSSAVDQTTMPILYFLKNLGNVGVDIFLFASGISLYHSFKGDGDIISFYKRRLLRILVPVSLVNIPFYFYKMAIGKSSIVGLIINSTGLNFLLNGNRSIWFVDAIVLCYLLYPLIHQIIKNKKISGLLMLIFASLIFNLTLSLLLPNFFLHTEIMWRRFPVFMIGCYFGKWVRESREGPSNLLIVLLAIAFTVIWYFISPYVGILERYTYGLLGIIYALLFSVVGKVLWKISKILAPITLEYYLIQEKLQEELVMFGSSKANSAIVAFLLSFIFAYIVHLLSSALMQKMKNN